MRWFIKTFWKSLSAVSGLLGMAFLASDVRDIPQALEGWRRVLAMVDQVTALWAFSILALAYIIWVDARPLIEKWRGGSALPIAVAEELAWTTSPFEVDGKQMFKNFCFLVVYNKSRSRKTAKSVRVRTYLLGDQVEARTRQNANEAEIHYGEAEWFMLGYIISAKRYGITMSFDGASSDDIASVRYGEGQSRFCFFREAKSVLSLHQTAEPSISLNGDPMECIIARVSASDSSTLEVRFRLDRNVFNYQGSTIKAPIAIKQVTTI